MAPEPPDPRGDGSADEPVPPDLGRLVELLRGVSAARDPRQVLRHFAEALHRGRHLGGFVSVSRRGLGDGEYRVTRRLLTDEDESIESGNPWRDAGRLPVHRGGLIAEMIAGGGPRLRNGLGAVRDAVLGPDAERFGSVMAVPLFDGGEPLNWALQLRAHDQPFTDEELREALLQGNLVGGNVRLVRLAEQIREAAAEQDAEVERIGKIQRALLPERLPDVPGASLAVMYQTPAAAGGDFYTVRGLGVDGLDRGRAIGAWGLVVADVSGHGPAAAVVMAMFQSILMAMPVEHQATAGTACAFLNEHLCSKRIEGIFVTALVAGYNPDTGVLRYARAGHPLPMVRRQHGDGGVEVLDLRGEGGPPLGVMPDAAYPTAEFRLQAGDALVLYTDGLEEARSPAGRFFGRGGIERALADCSGEADCLVETLRERLAEHEAGARAGDDQTVLAMTVRATGDAATGGGAAGGP
ncbi:PP2C family protein-serine/threonine phosphatase [Phycisphaera mikurensis]|uniref:Putative phosphatase n=1 Tax=Phycisphaera mikurensis (strain NBRC 102666 / KCTC 22515 / FYK2301M01) TaxID=1142394 RepID=I0IAL4_PHYMF|nr:PP2C family protein-serine/threonine phosphatase [Phycisphaera mikurensis]MBB6441702.1 sigma-B regulation protein RsbU (phosphoserine phosphatase) [Phycisphaera mikurensis]BAM02302.1 putative phosphatase [Phycisphaera mikurensis NBRC 102666]